MTTAPISVPYNLHAGASGTTGRSPEPARRLPKPAAEAAALLAALPDPLTEAALMEFILREVRQPTAAGAKALAHLAEIGREAAPEAADYLSKLSEAVAREVDRHDAFVKLAEALKGSVEGALELGRRLGREELEAELAADATKPVLERRVEFVSDDKGRITGKIEREFKPGGKEK
jgi:hypothetical protein